MKIIFVFIVFCGIFFLSCNQKKDTDLLPGLWKVGRVELLKNNEFNQAIDAGSQFWYFSKKDSIEIFNRVRIQNCLKVEINASSIKSIHRETGEILDEYFINKLNARQLELSTNTTLEDANYQVIYYLDKVTDTTAAEIMSGF